MSRTTCSRGHAYAKSSRQPVCPTCWPGFYRKLAGSDLPAGLSGPALSALLHAGITMLRDVAKKSEAEILALHGVGPATIPTLRAALRAKKLSLKK